MDTKQLRQKILDLAIRGKLVPQDPNNEPASVLLARVKAEKERLIAEGKIKRSKKTATTTDKPHYPFEIPNTWVWSTLGELFILQAGKNITADKINYEKNDEYRYPCYGGNGIRGYVVHYNKSGKYPVIGRQGALCGNLNYVEGKFYATEHAVPVETFAETIPYLAFLFLKQINLNQYATATAQPGLSVNKILDVPIPLPPKEEQARIVQEVLRLEAIVESIETNKEELFESLSKVKATILEYAISGKLVPQDPADEPAADLLQRVNPNAVVSADTSHYQHLPQGWCVCKLEDIVDYEQPQRYIVESTEYSEAYKTPVLTAGKSFVIGHTNETAGVFDKVPVIIFDDFTTDSKYVDFPFKVKSSAMKILHVKNGVNIKYVYFFMSITRLVGKTHKRYWISEYSKLDIPLPPYNEQCRIVDAIERINNRIDDIAEAL